MHPNALHSPQRRKMLIYGGVAAAMLLVLLLARRSSSSSSDTTATAATPVPVSNPAVDPSSYYTGGTGAGGVDYGPQLATLDTDVQTLAQAVQTGQVSAQTPGATTPAVGTVDPSAEITAIASALTGASAASVAAFQAGAASSPADKPPVVNVHVTTQKQPGPGNRKPRPSTARPPKPPAGHQSVGATLTFGPPTSRAHHRHG